MNAEVRRAAEKCGFLSLYCSQRLQRAAELCYQYHGVVLKLLEHLRGENEHQETSVVPSNAASHIYVKRGAKIDSRR